MDRNTKVRLTVDLTQYAQGLIAGSEGYTVGNQDIKCNSSTYLCNRN